MGIVQLSLMYYQRFSVDKSLLKRLYHDRCDPEVDPKSGDRDKVIDDDPDDHSDSEYLGTVKEISESQARYQF